MRISERNLQNTITELQKVILLQQQEIEKQNHEIHFQNERYIRLLEEIKLEKSRLFSSSSEKNIFQLDLFDEIETEIDNELKDQLDDNIDVQSYTRKKHPVRKPIPKDIPREIIVHDISDAEKRCACGSHLVRIGEEITEQIKYIPSKLSVTQHVRPKYACKPCQENVKIAPKPTLLLPKCLAGPELIAYTITAKYCDHIPLYRQAAI